MTDEVPQPNTVATGLAGLVVEAKNLEAKLEAMAAAPIPAPAIPPAPIPAPIPSPVAPSPIVPPATPPLTPPVSAMVISDEPIPVPADAVPLPTAAPVAPIQSPQLDALAKEEARVADLEAQKQAFYQRIKDARTAGLPPPLVPQPVPERIRVQTELEMNAGAAAVAAHAAAQGRRIIPATALPTDGAMTPVFTPGAFNEYHDTFKSPANTISKDALAQPRQPG